jgi:hypothetical protein
MLSKAEFSMAIRLKRDSLTKINLKKIFTNDGHERNANIPGNACRPHQVWDTISAPGTHCLRTFPCQLIVAESMILKQLLLGHHG